MRITGFLLLLGLFAGCHTTRETAGRSQVLGKVPTLTVPRTAAPPVVDGRLGDESWTHAAIIQGLLPPLTTNAVVHPKPLPTVVRVLWDAEFLYVAFDCVDQELFCTGTKKQDDMLFEEDVCEVFIDGVGDGRQFVEVQGNAVGENLDIMYVFTRAPEYTPEMRLTEDLCDRDRWGFLEWDMWGLRTAGRRTPTGWTVEMAIPAGPIMKRQGSPTFRPTEIRANFLRYDWPVSRVTGRRELHQQNWSPVVTGGPHISPARMGRLRLVE